jgi:hypothetical protein
VKEGEREGARRRSGEVAAAEGKRENSPLFSILKKVLLLYSLLFKEREKREKFNEIKDLHNFVLPA